MNEQQRTRMVEKIRKAVGGELEGRTIGVLGLSFKPETDDMREAPSIRVVGGLLERGAEVAVHDPVAMEEARRHFGDRVEYADDEYAACRGADAMVLVTEWLQYRRPDWDRLAGELEEAVVFDGRNLFEPERMRDRGFSYHPVGRETVA